MAMNYSMASWTAGGEGISMSPRGNGSSWKVHVTQVTPLLLAPRGVGDLFQRVRETWWSILAWVQILHSGKGL
jgi:hypothetical protein